MSNVTYYTNIPQIFHKIDVTRFSSYWIYIYFLTNADPKAIRPCNVGFVGYLHGCSISQFKL